MNISFMSFGVGGALSRNRESEPKTSSRCVKCVCQSFSHFTFLFMHRSNGTAAGHKKTKIEKCEISKGASTQPLPSHAHGANQVLKPAGWLAGRVHVARTKCQLHVKTKSWQLYKCSNYSLNAYAYLTGSCTWRNN